MIGQVRNAVKIVREQKCYPVFTEDDLDEAISLGKYIAIDASLAFQMDEDQDWSRDVLDVSNATSPSGAGAIRGRAKSTPGSSGEQIRRQSTYVTEEVFRIKAQS